MRYISFSLLILMSALTWSCGKKEAPATELKDPNGQEIPVNVVAVERHGSTTTIPASGVLASDTETRLAFKTGGIIQKLYVEEGARVQKGQLLAKLNLTEITAQVTQAEYGVEKARRDLDRVHNLYRDSAATLEQVQNLTTVLDMAKQNLEIARFNLQYSEIRAPHNGVVVKKVASEGELTAPGAPVYLLTGAGPANWVVKVGVPDKDWSRLRTGDAAEIRFDAYPDQVFQGRVSLIAPSADPMNGLYMVELKMETKESRFAPGLFAKAVLTSRKAGAQAVVPIEAIVEGDGKRAFVFVPKGDGVRKVPVLIAELSNTHAIIAQGLEGIDQVITAGSPYLTEKSRVVIVGGE